MYIHICTYMKHVLCMNTKPVIRDHEQSTVLLYCACARSRVDDSAELARIGSVAGRQARAARRPPTAKGRLRHRRHGRGLAGRGVGNAGAPGGRRKGLGFAICLSTEI